MFYIRVQSYFLLYIVNYSKSINSNCEVNSDLNDVHKESFKSSLDLKFIEWFVGLCEAESNFLIRARKNEKEEVSGFEFVFRISLHKDDCDVLEYIKNILKN